MTYPRYILVWVGLVILTFLTLTSASLDLGKVSIVVCLVIAALKSTLVILFFMNLLFEERKLLKMLVPIAVGVLAIFIGLTYTDLLFR